MSRNVVTASSDHHGIMSSRRGDIINMNFNNVNVPLSAVRMSLPWPGDSQHMPLTMIIN